MVVVDGLQKRVGIFGVERLSLRQGPHAPHGGFAFEIEAGDGELAHRINGARSDPEGEVDDLLGVVLVTLGGDGGVEVAVAPEGFAETVDGFVDVVEVGDVAGFEVGGAGEGGLPSRGAGAATSTLPKEYTSPSSTVT